MPTSVRVATVTMAILAALFLTYGALLWFEYDTAVRNTVGDGTTVSRGEAESFITSSLTVFLVLGALLGLCAWFLPRRQPWARWLGLAVSAILLLMAVLTIAATGGIPIYTLLVVVLALAAFISLTSKTTGAYVPRLRSRA